MFKEIREVANGMGSIHKQSLLKKHANVPGFKEVLKFIMNPYLRTGISEKKAFKLVGSPLTTRHITFEDAIEYFTSHQTGTDEDIRYGQAFMDSWMHDADAHWLSTGLVTKNLTIGVNAKTLNKVYGKSFIPKIDVMLGTNLKDIKDPVGPWIVTEKLDGHRRLLIKQDGVCSFYTRSGIPDNDLFVLLEDAAMLPDNHVYDGECLAIGNFKNALSLRQATNSIMNSSGPKAGITYNVFDIIPVEEFFDGKSKRTAFQRKMDLCEIFGCKSQLKLLEFGLDLSKAQFTTFNTVVYWFTTIIHVPILGIANTVQEALNYSKPIIARGFEGAMLNQVDSLYEVKRSKQLIKIKEVKSYDLEVVDMMPGTNKYQNMLGAVFVNYKGFLVGVGSGFTDHERKMYWEDKSKILHHIIEVDTFGETTNKQGQLSLNAPIFKGVRYDKDSSN